jgi:hypothetical protein
VLGKALEDQKDDRYQTAKEFRDALRASQQDTGSEELEEGSCPGCGTKNPTNRKFCRNESCGIDLQVACLSCSEKIPMWEGVCDSCGTKQSTLLQQRRDSMVSSQSEAESLLKSYEFDKAVKLATALHDEQDLRLQHLKGWAEKFLPQIEQGREQQLDRIGKLLYEAIAHDKAYDYSSGIHTLEQIPEILRSTEVSNHSQTAGQLLIQLQQKQSTIQQLDKEIRRRVKSRQLNGLREQVDNLLRLCPDRKDIQKLEQQLVDREAKLVKARDEAIGNAKAALQKHDYEAAIKELAQVDAYVQTEEVTRLSTDASENQSRLNKLRKTIEKATSAKQLHGLLKKVNEYLSLKPDDADMQKLQNRLQAREEKNAAQLESTVQKACSLRESCQFSQAIKTLQRIPQELITDEASDLLTFCESASVERSESLELLRQSQTSERYAGALAASKEYSALIRDEMLEDEEFQQAVQACKRSLIEQQEAEESAERRRALTIKLSLAAAAVTVVVLLIAAGLWIRSSLNASAVADAVQQQQWEEALAIDENCFSALVGRARSRIDSDPTGALDDLELAARSPFSSTDLAAYNMRIADLDRLIPIEKAAERKQRDIAVTPPPKSKRGKDYRDADAVRELSFEKATVHFENAQIMEQERNLIANQLDNLSNHDGRVLLLNSLKALAHAKRALANAQSGQIEAAEKDLAEAKQLGVGESYMTRGNESLARAYAKRAEQAFSAGGTTRAVSDGAKALSLDPNIELSASLFADARAAARAAAEAAAEQEALRLVR